MTSLSSIASDGGIITVLLLGLIFSFYVINVLFKKFDQTQDILKESKSITKKINENQEQIVSKLEIANRLSSTQLDYQKEIIQLHSKIIGEKLNKIDERILGNEKMLESINYILTDIRNSELREHLKNKNDERVIAK